MAKKICMTCKTEIRMRTKAEMPQSAWAQKAEKPEPKCPNCECGRCTQSLMNWG